MLQINPLTDTQLTQYREEGYTILGRIMNDATLESIRGEELRDERAAHPADASSPENIQ